MIILEKIDSIACSSRRCGESSAAKSMGENFNNRLTIVFDICHFVYVFNRGGFDSKKCILIRIIKRTVRNAFTMN